MKIKIVGAGWYGCHLSTALIERGHDVRIYDIASNIFSGASGSNPARLHMGQHYPRSFATRQHCQNHNAAFLGRYGQLTSGVPINIYAIADKDSLVDFGNYVQTLTGEIEFIRIFDPKEFGLRNVEGAILTGERHIVIRKARAHFESVLQGHLKLDSGSLEGEESEYDWTIDCTFCAQDSAGVDRYEPCVTALVSGPTGRAVTIMDGPFPSLYPWDEAQGLNSLTSAKYTPLTKCKTYAEAVSILENIDEQYITERTKSMFDSIAYFWPDIRKHYGVVGHKLGIRAMPRSGSDARLVDVISVGERALRVRAGKIDAVVHAEKIVCDLIGG